MHDTMEGIYDIDFLQQKDTFSIFFKFLLEQGPSCGATDCLYFGPSLWVSKSGWFSHLHTHLLVCSEPKGHVWCYTYLNHQ